MCDEMCNWENSEAIQINRKRTKDGKVSVYWAWRCDKGHIQLAGREKKQIEDD